MNNTAFKCTKSLMLRSVAAIVCVLTVGIAHVSAQDDFARHNLTINAGLSIVKWSVTGGLPASGSFDKLYTERTDFRSHPAIQFNYDYAVLRWLSTGVALSTQIFDVSYNVYEQIPG